MEKYNHTYTHTYTHTHIHTHTHSSAVIAKQPSSAPRPVKKVHGACTKRVAKKHLKDDRYTHIKTLGEIGVCVCVCVCGCVGRRERKSNVMFFLLYDDYGDAAGI
jgi:hypothetical protein